jgi:hypothetical protein
LKSVAAVLSSQSFVHGDARQPRGELCSPGELVEMLVRAHVRVLHYVLSLAIVAQNSPSRAVETLVVPAHDNLKHRGVAR